jgi:pimeloyl-ACP methyl ester carboxylesterase
MAWMANSVRTRGVPEELLASSQDVTVVDRETALELRPARPDGRAGLIFICGGGIHAHAYVPLLRPIADAGHPVFIVKLPYRFAPWPSHKDEAVGRVRNLVAVNREITRWVIAGHSLGGAIAARVAQLDPRQTLAFVLIGTTHPRENDLSQLKAPFTKVYATNDGVAPPDRVRSTARLLPAHTKWTEIPGGNHSQFGHYGRQLLDRRATIGREAQQAITREAILDALRAVPDAPGANMSCWIRRAVHGVC